MQGSYTFPCSMYFADYRKDIRENGFFTKTHWHDAVELLHFEEGTYLLTYNTEQLTISEEAFGFIESGRLHAIRSEDGYIEQAVLFEPSLLSVSTVDASKKTIIDPLLHSRVSFPKLLTASDPGFSEISEEFDRIMTPEVRGQITTALKEYGFSYVTLDLSGYRTGSMNEVLKI